MRRGRIRSAVLTATVVGCASSAPHHFGQYNDLAPRVAATNGERLPQHVTVQLARPANVAVFLVVPGRATLLLFPEDSAQSSYMEAGPHLVETSLAKQALSDSSAFVRRAPMPSNSRSPIQGRNGRINPRDTLPTFGFNQHGYLLVYASQQPLSYTTLKTRVAGLSVPISDDDALNTVTKLVRETTHTTGPWAAYSTDFPP